MALHSNITKTIFVCLLGLLFSLHLTAQEKRYIITDKKLDKKGLISRNLQVFNFKNLDAPYYYDETKRKEILKAEKSKDYDRLLPLLEEYISSFACENFSRDYELLWMLAQVYEKKGRLEEAKDMYRLVLKNTEKDRDFIWQIYDKLIFNEKDEYVPLDFYYELVDFRKQIDTLRPPRGVFLNMGDMINSGYEDYGPALNISNNVLLFTSKRNRKKIAGKDWYNEDVFWAAREDENAWRKAEPLEGINTHLNEGSPCITRDGRHLYFVRCEAPDGFGNCDLYVADLISDGNWGNVRNLGAEVNSPAWDSHPSLSHSEDTLYFVSDRDGGFGSTDIYFTTLMKNGKWAPARNMGPMVNTKDAEASPFYHPKYDVFYFSSNGQLLNFGEFDIFKTRLANGHWTEPKNIGPLVNGKGEEFYFTIDSESKDLFYARSEKKGFENVDLFSFPLPMEAQPAANTNFGGTLEDSITGEPFEGIVSIIDLTNGIEVAPKYLRSDGSFSFDLINNSRYLLIIQGENFFRIEKIFQLQRDTVMHFRVPAINFVRIEFKSIEFAINDWEILPEMHADLDRIMNFMLDNPTYSLKISGHTDQQGNAEANNKLSQQRANSIKEYLVTKGGIEPERIEAVGYGSTRPIVKVEKTPEDSKLNRRVEFEIIRNGETRPED
ncbi:MAG TPA: OmpA family protein [Chitinophagales bacterium]|nr:OmpA family protein [Chitinophagales bacterium]